VRSVLACPSLLGNSLTVKVPGVVHHKCEILVVVNGHRDVVVVLDPFIHGDDAISRVGVSLHVAEVVLECVQELVEYLVLRFFTRFDIWMLLSIIRLSDIVDIKLSRLIRVHNRISFLTNGNSSSVHLSSDASQELVVGDLAATISVEDVECNSSLVWMETNSEIVHCLLEFLFVKSLVVVVISNLELLANTRDSSGASGGNLLLNVGQDLSLISISCDARITTTLSTGWL